MRNRAILLMIAQCLLVSSVAGKYLYERATRPRVWTRAAQFDPNLPMRGRYLALTPMVDACGLPRDHAVQSSWLSYQGEAKPSKQVTSWQWRVVTKAKDGKLVAEVAPNALSRSETQSIWLSSDQPCETARLTPAVDFFIPDTAKPPFPLELGQELWIEVTVPPKGPPRPIQLALNDRGQWKLLKFQ